MRTRSAPRRRFLPGSPFNDLEPEAEVEVFAVHDRVTHDKYGLGRVIKVDGESVTVDFGPHQIHIGSPFPKLTKL